MSCSADRTRTHPFVKAHETPPFAMPENRVKCRKFWLGIYWRLGQWVQKKQEKVDGKSEEKSGECGRKSAIEKIRLPPLYIPAEAGTMMKGKVCH